MFVGEAVSELWPPPPPSLLPDGLEVMAPGPELAGVLAEIDVDSLPGFDLVVVMAAQARMVAHHQAECWVWWPGWATPPPMRAGWL